MDNHTNQGEADTRREQLKELVRKGRAAERKLNGNPALEKEWIDARNLVMGFRGIPEHDALVDAYLLAVRTYGSNEHIPAQKALRKYYTNLLRKTPLKPRKRKPRPPEKPPTKMMVKLIKRVFKFRELIAERDRLCKEYSLERNEEQARTELGNYAQWIARPNTLTKIMFSNSKHADRDFERYIKRVYKMTLKAK
ncbi:hypothetical protein UFOVP341_18 [uncultured Caudovirales phage]|uniref:Uncharacterized protein n=1 Tax=uncultured Caudovirales phage TaxID=2100421 RepID=A0A6J5M1C3_9CAUD|nr:hypothetical protein UFOVP341_18 [uncultured Caudovirales phage]